MRSPDEHDIIRAVAVRYSLRSEDVLGLRSTERVSRAREVAMYLVRHLLGFSLPETGRVFRRHHTTVHSAVGRVTFAMTNSQSYATMVAELSFELASIATSGEYDLDAAWKTYRRERRWTHVQAGTFDDVLWARCVADAAVRE